MVSGALGLGLVGRWLDWVVASQSGAVALPSGDVLGDYFTGVLWAVLLGAGVWVWGGAVRFRAPLLTAWAGKVLVALGLMLFYDFRYGVDPDGYFVNASTPGFTWQGFWVGTGTRNVQNLAWLHIQILSGSYHASRLTFTLIGLIGVYLVYRAGVMYLGREDRRVFFVVAFFPSIVFWSSILGKDPVSFLGVALYVYGVVGWHRLAKVRYLLWIALGIAVAMFVRVWLGPILLLPLTVLGWSQRGSVVRRTAFILLGAVGVLVAPLVIQEAIGVDVVQQDELLETTNSIARSFEEGGSSLEVPDLETYVDIVTFVPLGTFTVLFRPLPGEILNAFGFLASIENAILILLVVRAIRRTKLRDLREPVVLWALAVVLLWAFVYSVGTYGNLGTAVRHRLEIMPPFLGVLLYLGRRRQRTASGGSADGGGSRVLAAKAF